MVILYHPVSTKLRPESHQHGTELPKLASVCPIRISEMLPRTASKENTSGSYHFKMLRSWRAADITCTEMTIVSRTWGSSAAYIRVQFQIVDGVAERFYFDLHQRVRLVCSLLHQVGHFLVARCECSGRNASVGAAAVSRTGRAGLPANQTVTFHLSSMSANELAFSRLACAETL